VSVSVKIEVNPQEKRQHPETKWEETRKQCVYKKQTKKISGRKIRNTKIDRMARIT